MYNIINVEEDVIIKVDLYKNRREKIAEIPLDFIENIAYKFNDIDEISLTIPKNIMVRKKMVSNHIYSKISTRQQLIVTTISKDGSESKQRFVLHNKKVVGNRNVGSKSFVAYSWQKTLEKQRITVEQLSRQLTNKDDTVHIGEGVLDLICKKTGWNVGYVDPDARYKTNQAVETFSMDLFTNLNTGVITEGGVIFDKQVNIPAKADKPTYLTINYTNLKTIHNNTTIANVNILNNLSSNPFYSTITNIKAEHYSDTGNRYGIKYTFTLDIPMNNPNDKNTIEITESFTNCLGKTISCDKIFVGYDYGDVIEVKNIQYANFEAFDDSAYKFLEDVGEVFDCIFLYDTMTNTINVYAKENLKENNGYRLALDRNIQEVNISENDEIVTCLKVESDNTSIAEENPNGTNVIENYDYYIKHNLMSDGLKATLEKYDVLARDRQVAWLRAKTEKSVVRQRYTKAQSEAKTLEERIKNLNFRLTQYITDKMAADQLESKREIDALELQYNNVIRQMSVYQNEINALTDTMAAISVSINKPTATDENGNRLFSDEDLQELNDMVEIDTLNDSYYTTSYGLYNYAVKYLNEKVVPTLSFDMSVDDLKSYVRHISGWNKVLKLGNVFTLDNHDIFEEFGIKEVRFVGYKLKPLENGKRFKMTDLEFSNKIKLENTLKVGANIGRTTNKTTGIVTTFRDLWENSKVTNNFVGDMITSGLNLAAANIRGGVYRNILDFSEAGCFIINNTDAGDTSNQIYLGGGTIAITTDGWATSKVAIDANGVIAETLLGKILLGEKLVITADNGQFYVGPGETQDQKDKNEFGIYIYDSIGGVDRIFLGLGEVEENGVKVRKAQLRLKDKTGRQVVLSEDGIVQTSQFVCWDNVSPNFPMRIPYFCDAGVVENRKIVLSMVFEKYRAFERGMTSGGQLQSTPSGGGGTTPAGGGGTSEAGGTTSFSGGGTTSRTDGGRTVQSTSADGGGATVGHTILASNITGNPQYQETIDLGPSNDVADYGRHYHRVSHQFYVHGHNVDVRIPSHRHSVTVSVPSHTHEIPDHTHNIAQHRHTLPDHTHTIPNHTHTLDTTHSHQLEYGIFEQESNCSNVRVYVNNVLAGQNINSNVDLDITQHIRINQRNDIRIETQTNGRITCNLFTKSFVAF